ncbi:hypothetical protein ACWCXB_06675 [Streptomyces sp. NPDC001514]
MAPNAIAIPSSCTGVRFPAERARPITAGVIGESGPRSVEASAAGEVQRKALDAALDAEEAEQPAGLLRKLLGSTGA